MIAHGHAEARKLQTRAEAEQQLGDFFGDYISEWHPCKNEDGQALYPFVLEILSAEATSEPLAVDLLEVLDEIFTEEPCAPNLQPLHHLLVGLIEEGQRHTMHDIHAPTWGVHQCARKGSVAHGKAHVYCRYLFPRLLRLFDELQNSSCR